MQKKSDILIVGAGIVGLALALELNARGAQVTVLERDTALSHASFAAAGMLAVDDPNNPAALLPFSRLSITEYPGFLSRIESLTGIAIPYQTDVTIQHRKDSPALTLAEHSLDPRQLADALLRAVRSTSIDLRENTALQFTRELPDGVAAHYADGSRLSVSRLVYTTGAWTDTNRLRGLELPLTPRKGQMLRVPVTAGSRFLEVHRSEHMYVVPRHYGPQAGSVIIGATLEDAGFDTTVHSADLTALRSRAAELFPAFASVFETPPIESWAGLRPATPDDLPFLGRIGDSEEFLAAGHFRNGILLAPGTAVLLADLVERKRPAIDMAAFEPARFTTKNKTR